MLVSEKLSNANHCASSSRKTNCFKGKKKVASRHLQSEKCIPSLEVRSFE